MIRLRDLLGEATVKKDTPYVSGDNYISRKDAQYVYNNMGYDFNFEEFYKGMNVELEHQDVTEGSLTKTAMIAAAHLKEVPDYYTKLQKYVEPQIKKEDGAPIGTGLNLPGGYINAAPKPKDVKKVRKQLNTESKMIRLKDILSENVFENRINLMEVQITLEKILPELSKTESAKLVQLCSEIYQMASELNKTPYTKFNMEQWALHEMFFKTKLVEVKDEAMKLCESDKVNVYPLIKELEKVLAQ